MKASAIDGRFHSAYEVVVEYENNRRAAHGFDELKDAQALLDQLPGRANLKFISLSKYIGDNRYQVVRDWNVTNGEKVSV